MNVQVACAISGCLAWISDPIRGSCHDHHCLGESGVRLSVNPQNWFGDKGYVGNDMITPFKKPEGGELLDWQKEFMDHTGIQGRRVDAVAVNEDPVFGGLYVIQAKRYRSAIGVEPVRALAGVMEGKHATKESW